MWRLLPVLLLIMFSAGAPPASAHRFAASFSVVEIRVDKAAIQVTHRLFTHDVEDLIRSHSRVKGEITDDHISAFLRDYVGGSFALYDPAGNRIALDWLGYEYSVQDIYVYQEAVLPDGLGRIGVIDNILTDTFPDQTNRVNIQKGNEIHTLIFRKGDGLRDVEFGQN